MCNFSLGVVLGTIVGASLMLAVHPMNRRDVRRAYHKAEKMMNRMGNTIRELA